MTKQQTVEMVEIKEVRPKMYCAVLHNDDTTAIDFVMYVLVTVYHKSAAEAMSLAQQAHTNNKAIITRGTKNYLNTLSNEAMGEAKRVGYPQFTITNEPEE